MMLTKTRSILHRTNVAGGRVYFAPEEDPQTALVSIDEATWRDADSPDVVTVTIQPGDLLNDD